MRSLISISLCLWIIPLTGRADTVQFYEILLERVDRSSLGEAYGIRWTATSTTPVCEGFHEVSEQMKTWKKLPTKACAVVRNFIGANLKAIQRDPLAESDPSKELKMNFRGHAPIGVLTQGNLRVPVTWNLAELCDSTLSHCHTPKLSAASELGKVLREQITLYLGR